MPTVRPHILVVDDEPEIGRLVERFFGGQGLDVTLAASGAELRAALAGPRPVDLVLLDLGLPDGDGLDLLRGPDGWRGPVIIVSGRGDSIDRIVGLELGADDYVTKPFDLRELLARVRSVLRRTQAPPVAVAAPSPLPPPAAIPAAPTSSAVPPADGDAAPSALRFSGYELDVGARRLLGADGVETPLTTGEFELLLALLARPNQVLSRDQLMNRLHGRDSGPFDRAIDVQVARLRRKIEADPARPQLIKSVRGAGYLFAARVERA